MRNNLLGFYLITSIVILIICYFISKPYINEGCNESWIRPDFFRNLSHEMHGKFYGQHIVDKKIFYAASRKMVQMNPKKALVISLQGNTGTGKTYLTELIGNAAYVKGMKSQFIHHFIGSYHFPYKEKLNLYRDQIQSWIKGNISICPQSLFIFDEVDKMPPMLMDAILPFVGTEENEGINSKKSTFIIISNNGGEEISRKTYEYIQNGIKRKEIPMEVIEDIARYTAATGCSVGPVDIVFVLDSSASVEEQNFAIALHSIKNFVTDLLVRTSEMGDHIGLVTFDETATVQFGLSSLKGKYSEAILKTSYSDGLGTNVARGMETALTSVFNQTGDRSNVPNIMIIITDGIDNSDIVSQQKLAEEMGVTVFAIGLGKDILTEKLEVITGSPDRVFNIQDWSKLYEVLRKICVAKGGLARTELIKRDLIDYYLPFLPLERKHVRKCIEDYIRSRGKYCKDEIIDKILSKLYFTPPENPIFSVSGCKHVDEKAKMIMSMYPC